MQKSLKLLFESLLRFGMNCVKSDKFRAKRPENPSRPAFSAASTQNENGGRGPQPLEGGLSTSAGIRESFCGWADIMRQQLWPKWPLEEGFPQEVKS